MKFTLTSVFMALLCLGGRPAAAEQLPIDDFVQHGDYLDLKISPDGKHLAARIRSDESVYLVFLRTSDKEVVGGVRPSDNSEVHSVTWVNNERVVYEYAQRRSGLDQPSLTGELFAVNIDGSRSKLLYGYRAGDAKIGTMISRRDDAFASQEVLSVLPDDERHILIIEYPWELIANYWHDNRSRSSIISKLNVYTGKKVKIETLPNIGTEAVASESGAINFISWLSKGDVFYAAQRQHADAEWQPLAVPFADAAPYPVSVNAAATKAYLIIPYGERELDTLFELDLATGKYTQLFDGLSADLGDFVVDSETLEPVVGISYFDKGRYYYVDPSDSPMIKTHRLLTRAFAGKDISITSRTRDGKHILVRADSDVDPGEYYILDTETNKAEFLWANRSWVDPAKMRPSEHLEFRAEDGTSYYGYLTLPQLAEGTPPPPLVVVPHGGPQSRDYWGYDTEAQLLANRGYAVLQVNFRGSSGYGDVFLAMGNRQWGGKMIDDIVSATRDVVESGKVDGERMCIYGASYGGYAALMSAARAPKLYRCAIGYAGIYDLRLMFEKGDIPDFWGGPAYLARVLGHDEAQLADYSPINHVDKIDAAVMLIHGSKDLRAPVAHANSMRKKLESAGKDVTWQLYGDSAHGVYSLQGRREMYQGLLDFLDAHIGSQKQLAQGR